MPKWFQLAVAGVVVGASVVFFSFAVGYKLYKSVTR